LYLGTAASVHEVKMREELLITYHVILRMSVTFLGDPRLDGAAQLVHDTFEESDGFPWATDRALEPCVA
jgi:hypothetical protein